MSNGCDIISDRKAGGLSALRRFFHIFSQSRRPYIACRHCGIALSQAAVTLNPKSGKGFSERIEYVGHITRPGRLKLTLRRKGQIIIIEIVTSLSTLCQGKSHRGLEDLR